LRLVWGGGQPGRVTELRESSCRGRICHRRYDTMSYLRCAKLPRWTSGEGQQPAEQSGAAGHMA
ncbi:MAG: hypothetical protein ACLPKH_06370, partial [Rhodomicrobium sp.]